MGRSILKVSGRASAGIRLVRLLTRGFLSRWRLWPALMAAWVPLCGSAQAPDLMWTTNVGAQVFAVDDQTNVYANAGGSVIKLNSSGLSLQTNNICPLPGIARLDAAGNYLFGGSFDGTQDFGGITLVG